MNMARYQEVIKVQYHIFKISPCVKEIIQVLEKYNATIPDMKEVFKAVKKEVTLKATIHAESDVMVKIPPGSNKR